jgi:hypothetical protein
LLKDGVMILGSSFKNVVNGFLNRLEGLYVRFREASFESHPGCLNEKLQHIGCLIDEGRVRVDWTCFPIMKTFLGPLKDCLPKSW